MLIIGNINGERKESVIWLRRWALRPFMLIAIVASKKNRDLIEVVVDLFYPIVRFAQVFRSGCDWLSSRGGVRNGVHILL
jgi:hypothetical protein